MTPKELNRDIKRLANGIIATKDTENFLRFLEEYARGEFTRLYYADPSLSFMSKASIRIMLRLNISYNFIAFHRFGATINIEP